MIDPKTGLEITPKPTYTDTVQQPISASVTPVKVNIGGTQPNSTNSTPVNTTVPSQEQNQQKIFWLEKNTWSKMSAQERQDAQNTINKFGSNTDNINRVMSFYGSKYGTLGGSNTSGGLSNLKIATPQQEKLNAPTSMPAGLSNEDFMKQFGASGGQIINGVQTMPKQPVTTPAPTGAVKPNNISQADWDKIQTEGTKNIKDTYASYNIAKGQYETNKNYYTNFDEKNNQFNNVLNSLQTAQSQNQNAPLTDAQYQNIASQYGLTIDQVKNPLNIFSQGLVMTDEGKRKLGVATAEQNITDATTQYERTKADLAVKTQQTQDYYNNQISDVQKQLTRNIDWMNAQGAWSGANRSSGYVQGIQNVANDGQTTINRLKTLAEAARTADEKSVARLTEDFNLGITRAKTALDDQMKQVNQSAGLQLAGLTEQYGLGNKTLTTELDKIMKDMDSKTAEAQGKYIANLKAIQSITTTNIENFTKLKDLNDSVANKRTTELLANNGAILQNTSLTTLSQGVQDGSISPQKYADLKSYMLSGIQTALGKLGTLTTQDTHTIEHLLETGSTPAQVIAKMQETGRFARKKTIEKTVDLGNSIRISYSDGTFEDVAKTSDMKPVSVASGSYIYDPTTGIFKSPTWESVSQPGVSGGLDLRSKSSLYPNEASIKNNNPAGITYNTSFAKNLQNAGIQFTIGTSRPSAEGGNYFSFPNIEEGMKAYNLLWNSPSYTSLTVWQALKRWGTDSLPGVNTSKKVSNLTEQEKEQLQMAQIKKESPGMYRELSSVGYFWREGINIPTVVAPKLTDEQKIISSIPKSKKDTATLIGSNFVEVPTNSNYGSKVVSTDWDVLAKVNNLWENEKKSVESWIQVKSALPNIKGLFDTLDKRWLTGPIAGRTLGKAAGLYDTDVQTVNSFLNSVLPNLARGVYGEVGVLTDNDIANYRKTLADLTQTTEARNKILGELQNKIDTNLPRKIESLEKSNYNIEWYRYLLNNPTSNNIMDRIKELRNQNQSTS